MAEVTPNEQKVVKPKTKHDVRSWLAIIALAGCLLIVIIMLFHGLPDKNKDILNIALGFLFGSCLSPVFQFFFGSSKIEADKNKKNG